MSERAQGRRGATQQSAGRSPLKTEDGSRKMETIEAAPASAGQPLRKLLQGFRRIHSGRYRIIWRLPILEDGERVAGVVYASIHSGGDERNAYAEFTRLFGLLEV